jgi:YVTN family beta-propeller protein
MSVLGSVKVGARPWGLALSPDGHTLYVANGPSDDVSVVTTDPLHVEATVKVGKRPWGVAVLSVK